MDSWHSYPSIFSLGHRAIRDILAVPVNVEEKVDGSQFSFGLDFNGELLVRSKGATLNIDAPEKMFTAACATVKRLAPLLHPGWTYRGEYLAKPKHNTLSYNRMPDQHIMVFDINPAHEEYLPYEEKAAECARLGLECIPLLFQGKLEKIDEIREFLNRESVLGGQRIEGVVIKPTSYNLFGEDKKALLGKFVSEAFKEIHQGEWKKTNPTSADVVTAIGDALRTPARWSKAVIHLREQGKIADSPKDIGAILPEVQDDIYKEMAEEIRDRLFKWAWPTIKRQVVRGLPEWYKDELMKKQFEGTGFLDEPTVAEERPVEEG